MDWDALLLSRLQFAFTVAFHIIFPSFTIGLASYLAVLEGLWLKTGNVAFRNLYLFWVKIFALAFGMGVVSGVVMSYQFGTNWSVFADMTGSVLGPLLGFEVLSEDAAAITIGSVLKYREDTDLVVDRSLSWLVGSDA